MKHILFLLAGHSGGGKSTLGQIIANYHGIEHFEADQYFINEKGEYNWYPEGLKAAHATCFENVCRELDNYRSVVVANTFIKKSERERYIKAARERGAAVQEIFVRSDDFTNTHQVPEEKVQQMKNNFQYT